MKEAIDKAAGVFGLNKAQRDVESLYNGCGEWKKSQVRAVLRAGLGHSALGSGRGEVVKAWPCGDAAQAWTVLRQQASPDYDKLTMLRWAYDGVAGDRRTRF